MDRNMDQCKGRSIAAALTLATLFSAGAANAQTSRPWSPRPTPLTPTAGVRTPVDPLGQAAERQHLADQIVEQLRLAHQSAGRGADQTAARAAVEALRAIAVIRDQAIGGTTHAVALQVALTAVREAGDFADRFGRVDAAAVSRLVAVHQTPSAARLDTSRLTPGGAITTYLAVARGRLVFATGGGPLAAEAVSILADLSSRQHRLTTQGDAQSAAAGRLAADVSLMYRRAAADIDPASAAVLGRLGRSLVEHSLAAAAVPVLRRSVAMQPLRENVAALAKATRITGDHATSEQLHQALASEPLPTGRPLTVMTPQQFAATGPRRPSTATATATAGQPDPAIRTASRPESRPAVAAVLDPSTTGGSFFGRR